MAFSLQALVGTITYNLSDGNPFALKGADGFGLPAVTRYSQTSPLSQRVRDLGGDLASRHLTLTLSFNTTSDADLDGHRDTLYSIFGGYADPIVKLRITRDDGAVRQINAYATDAIIGIVPGERAGHLHTAVVHLRSADPKWYNPTPGTVTLTQPVSDWWTGGGVIASNQVMTYAGTPAADEAWGWAGTIPADQYDNARWSVMWRASYVAGLTGAVDQYAWIGGGGTPEYFLATGTADYPHSYKTREINSYAGSWNLSGERIYAILKYSPYTLQIGTIPVFQAGYLYFLVYNPTTKEFDQFNSKRSIDPNPLVGGGFWGGDGSGTAAQWGTTLTHAVIHRNATYAQLSGIAGAIHSQAVGTASRQGIISYDGDFDEYPTLSITGPIADPIITNLTTGNKLDFTGATIPAGVTYTINLGTAPLYVVDNGGTIRTGQLADNSEIGSWSIAPDPIATGGTNLISLDGSAVSAATQAKVVYYSRYASY